MNIRLHHVQRFGLSANLHSPVAEPPQRSKSEDQRKADNPLPAGLHERKRLLIFENRKRYILEMDSADDDVLGHGGANGGGGRRPRGEPFPGKPPSALRLPSSAGGTDRSSHTSAAAIRTRHKHLPIAAPTGPPNEAPLRLRADSG